MQHVDDQLQPPVPQADAAASHPAPLGDARLDAIARLVFTPPALLHELPPQVFVGFDGEFDLPERQHVRFAKIAAPEYEMVFERGSVVFLVGDLARHIGASRGAGDRFHELPSYGRVFNEKLGVEFVAVPALTNGETIDERGRAMLRAEIDRGDAWRRASCELGDLMEGTLWWDPSMSHGTLFSTRDEFTPISNADGLIAQEVRPQDRRDAIADLCTALAGIRRYNGRSKINVARHSLLVGEGVRRRGIARTPDDGLSPGPVLERLALFLGASHDLPEATGDGDMATPYTRLLSGPARDARRAAKAACFHLVDATRRDGTVADLAAIFPVIATVDAEAGAMEYGWCFGGVPPWVAGNERLTLLAERMITAKGKLKKDHGVGDEAAGRHLAALLDVANTAERSPSLVEMLADHPFTVAALEAMST